MKDSSYMKISYENKPLTNEETNPSLVVFPLNYPNISILNNEKETQWLYGQNKEKKLKNDKSLICSTPKIIYEGRNKANSNRSEYVLGIINKKTKRTIALYDIDSLFPMNQKIRKVEENPVNMDMQDKTVGATKLELMASFGTAKAQKMALNMKTNIVGEDNIASVNAAKKILKQTAEDQTTLSLEDEAKRNQLNTMRDILPAFDLNAKEVSKIFNYNSVVDREVLLKINVDDIIACMKNKCIGLSDAKFSFCEFVIEYFTHLSKNVAKGKDMSNKIKMGVYLNDLIKFYSLPKIIKDDSAKLAKKMKMDITHVDIMLKKYAKASAEGNEKVFYVKEQVLILRNIFHILCVALLLNSYEFDFSSLARSMKLEIKVITSYFREMGCSVKSTFGEGKETKVKKGGKATIAQLKAPLKLNTGMKNFSKRK